MNNIEEINKQINELKKEYTTKKELLIQEKIKIMFKDKLVKCPRCNGTNLFIEDKSKNGIRLIGLYCKDCKKNKKKTGYIKFLSKEEHEYLKGEFKK